MKYLILAGFAFLLASAVNDMPNRGNPDNPPNQLRSSAGSEVAGNYYIRQAYKDAKTPNIVTVILGDYRGLDTLGEQIVVFTAGFICLLVLRRKEPS